MSGHVMNAWLCKLSNHRLASHNPYIRRPHASRGSCRMPLDISDNKRKEQHKHVSSQLAIMLFLQAITTLLGMATAGEAANIPPAVIERATLEQPCPRGLNGAPNLPTIPE
ncbi:hypothetical protein CC79DRAFT_1401778 [Sarocladium strictum]